MKKPAYNDFAQKMDEHLDNIRSVSMMSTGYTCFINVHISRRKGRDEDKQAIDVIKEAFPAKIIETIDYTDVAQEGGLLNCTTWVVY